MKTKIITGLIFSALIFRLVQLANSEDFIKLIEHTQDKVVKIGVVLDKGQGVGSGEFVSKEGLVLTCAHVVAHTGVRKIFVKTDDERVFKASVYKIDMEHDLALLIIDTPETFPYFTLGDKVKRGQQVVAFGSALGIQHTVTVGWVENLIERSNRYVFHSAFVNPGNSGGPLVDTNGKLVGVNEAMLMLNFIAPAPGLCVAIDIDIVKDFLRGEI